MRIALICLALCGCAAGPTSLASRSNWDVCTLTMSDHTGKASAAAEAQRRGLDCQPYYGPIQAKLDADRPVALEMLRNLPPVSDLPHPKGCTIRAGQVPVYPPRQVDDPLGQDRTQLVTNCW